jgi:cell division protein FtsL
VKRNSRLELNLNWNLRSKHRVVLKDSFFSIDRTAVSSFRPLLSLIFLILTLLSLVFVQMEERRLGYQVFKLEREHRNLLNQRRMKEIQLARLTKPQHVKRVAQQRLSLRKTEAHQVIHLNALEESVP